MCRIQIVKFSEISQSLGYLWMPTYSFELEEKIPFYIRFVSSILERLDFCAVLGTNTGGLHITLAIPNSFLEKTLMLKKQARSAP